MLGVFDAPYDYRWEMIHDDNGWSKPGGASYAAFNTPNGRILVQFLTMHVRNFGGLFPAKHDDRPVLYVKQFNISQPGERPRGFEKLGWNIAGRVLGTIAAMVREYVSKTGAFAIYYSAMSADRLRAYTLLARRLKLAGDVIAMEVRQPKDVYVLLGWGKKPLPEGMRAARLPRRKRRRS
jgi:hypothetical protein